MFTQRLHVQSVGFCYENAAANDVADHIAARAPQFNLFVISHAFCSLRSHFLQTSAAPRICFALINATEHFGQQLLVNNTSVWLKRDR